MLHIRTVPALIALALLAPATAAQAQTAAEIIGTMSERHTARMASVNNYTTTQSVMGADVVTYFEKTGEEGGIPIYEPKVTIVAGMRSEMEGGDNGDMNGLVARMKAAQERATLQGTEDLNGRAAWVLRFDGVDELGWSAPSAGSEGFTPKVFVLHVEREQYVPLRMRFEGEMNADGTMQSVAVEVTMDDYREVQSMLHPFKMSLVQEGMLGASGADPDEIRAQIEMARAQIASVPESQRAMVSAMLDEQIKAMEGMLAGEPIEMLTTDLKVNAGPPGGD
jgi:hypothetical protein